MSLTKNAKRHRWALDFTTRTRGDRQTAPHPELSAPLGYSDKPISESASSRESNPDLIAKKSWDVALGPVKQIPMNLFIMWMAGNSISIFPIMMVGMMFIRPIQALLHIQQTFKMIEGPQSMLMRVVYFLGNVMGLGLAIYKCQVMGLLPTHPSDWLAFVEPQMQQEWTGGGVVL